MWAIYLTNAMTSYWYLIAAAQVMANLPIAIVLAYLPRHFLWLTWVWIVCFVLGMFGLIVMHGLAFVGFYTSVRSSLPV